MKILKLGIYLIVSHFSILAQTDTTITWMKGLQSEDNTYLVYETKKTYYSIDVDSSIFTINVYDLQNNQTSIIAKGFVKKYYPENQIQYSIISDIEFIDNDPNKFIYAVNSLGIDPDSRIIRYDVGETFGLLGFIDDIIISKENQNRIIAVGNHSIFKSFDGGLTWPEDSSVIIPNDSLTILTLSPFDESVIFATNSKNNLVKSVDYGKTFFIVDNKSIWKFGTKLYFDNDRKHIYSHTVEIYESSDIPYIDNNLLISNDEGNPYTWNFINGFDGIININIDDSLTGSLYLSSKNELFESKDYGINFNKITELDHYANSVFKSPKKNIIYASSSNGLVKIDGTMAEYLFKKGVRESLSLYPLQVGNKWVYNESGVSYDIFPEYFSYDFYEEVTKDTVTEQGLHYYYIEQKPFGNKYWLRIDSTSGKVLIKYSDQEEIIFTDLSAQQGDYLYSYQGIISHVTESDTLLYDMRRYSKNYFLQSLFTYKMTFTQNIGVLEKQNEFDFGNSTTSLKGCLINGILYGDTVLVNVKNYNIQIPSELKLSQNYPNPFNPTTTIEYSIPSVGSGSISSVRLAVYDVLGREIAILVDEQQSVGDRPGNYTIQFDGSNLSSGIYYYKLTYNNFSQAKKMIILK